jgi:NAD(P)-dependent dehydrogenase (short-subunit alcohol dehydrogenase family)
MASLVKPFSQAFSHAQIPSLASKVYLVTGASNGLGLSVSRSLYSKGATVHMLSLNEEIARSAQAYIKSGNLEDAPKEYAAGFDGVLSHKDTSGSGEQIPGGKLEFEQCNLEDLNEVAKTAKELKSKLERLDGVFLLAGKGVNEFSLTKDGYE